MRKSVISIALLASAALSLSACGGGGGGGGGVDSTPPPPPPPPPPTGAFLAPGVTTTTDFAVMGYERGVGDTSIADFATAGFSVRYDAATQTYQIGLPSFGGSQAAFTKTNENPDFIVGSIPDSTGTANVVVLNPAVGPYQYSNLATVDISAPPPASAFAFGLATPSASMPVTGSATYTAKLAGQVVDFYGYFVGGSGTFNFNFAGGTLSGNLSPLIVDGFGTNFQLGPYTFNNTVYATGSTTFSGAMTHANGKTGEFAGRFTGPAAQELIGRFNLQFVDPYASTTETIFGAFVGKK